jgi:hypothetical protein
MIAVHRTFDELAMRAARYWAAARRALSNRSGAPHGEILRALQTLFPPPGQPMVGVWRIGWASPTLVQFELGLIYEWGNQHRLII